MDSSDLRQLQKLIREALNHLHDPGFLRRSSLAAAFGVAGRFDTPSAVRNILVNAIDALQPQSGEPPGSRAWEVFQSLYYRYVEQFTQEDVANQMGISLRQLRRLQQSALEALAYRLAEQFHPQHSHLPPIPPPEPAPSAAANAGEELDWLKASPPEETTDPSEALPAAVELLRPLARQRGVSVEITLEKDLPHIAAHPIAVRQAFLNVLTVAVLNSPSDASTRIRAVADAVQGQVRITIDWETGGPAPQRDSAEDRHKLEFAQRLVELCAGRLQVAAKEEKHSASFIFSALAQQMVLAIDDNAQALQLLQRYVAGTRYRVVGTQDASEALELIRTRSYQVIVVDVMMPHTDGWTVLAELKQSPLTGAIPIIVCTVLPQRELALSLGANDFVQKPVSRQAFLQALDRQVSLRRP